MGKRLIPTKTAKRLEALADGVFAIAMTLLVLELAIPVLSEHHTNTEITRELANLWPKFLSYSLSFLILGVYWIIHHYIFENINLYDSTLAWLNILFLMFVSLIPFTTSLMGEYFLERTPTLIYGIQLLIMFLLGFSLFTYSTTKFRLVNDDYPVVLRKGAKYMAYIYFTILTTAILFSFFYTVVSVAIYGLIVVVFIIFTGLGRSEYVVSAGLVDEKDSN